MDVEQRVATDPYFTLQHRLIGTVLRARGLMGSVLLVLVGVLAWIQFPFTPADVWLPMLLVVSLVVLIVHGWLDPHWLLRRHAGEALHSARPDLATVAYMERQWRAGIAHPRTSYERAMHAADRAIAAALDEYQYALSR